MSNPQSLNLRGVRLSADDLAHLREQSDLTALSLEGTDLTDEGLASLKDLTNLVVLNLTETPVGDAGLVHLHRLKRLRFLVLNQTRVTDAGLEHLAELSELEFLGLKQTAVTADGVRRLKGRLAACNVETDYDESKAAGLSGAEVEVPPETPPAPAATYPSGEERTGVQPSGSAVASSQVEPSASAPASTADDSIPIRFGRYYVIKALGQGRMGTVYLAHDEQLDRKVALKIPKLTDRDDPDAVSRFYQEARLAAKLHHRNICPVYDIGETGGRPYIAMAYIEGRELTQFINPKKLQSEKVVATVVRKLALAVREAHSIGIVHRDLKPANVIIDRQYEPVVMDFGLARTIIRSSAGTTEDGAIHGTPAYIAPEQIEGRIDQLGPASDVFSLGVLFYELLTGQLPFQGTVKSVLTQIITTDPPKPSQLRPGLNPELEAICLKMLAKRLEDRYMSMSGVAAAITEYLGSLKGRAP